jgi:small subunit ribosomal protein S21
LTAMTKVVVREGESLDAALRRFRKDLAKSGVLRDARKHEHYEKPSEKKRRERAKRLRKAR